MEEVHPSSFYRIERRWAAKDQVILRFPMEVRTSRWYHNSVAVERGPLVFALKIADDWKKVTRGMQKPAPPPAADWEVSATTPWNYGLVLPDDHSPQQFKVVERPIGAFPYSADGAPVEIRVRGRRLPDWKLVNGSAGPLPYSPASSQESIEDVTLIPYGSAKLRITAFPQLEN
jgi:hypothetical protein